LLGPRLVEKAYARALSHELGKRGIPHQREVRIPLLYDGVPLGVPFRADFVCHGCILLELKAVPALAWSHRRQLIHYLHSTGMTLGLLLNFGSDSLQIGRVVA